MSETTLNIYGIVPDSIVDGPGLRFAVFVQGCSHHCHGCHNPESWPVDGGTVYTIDDIIRMLQSTSMPQGVTLSGGDPFEQPVACAELARRVKELGFNVWAYSGYTYEQLQEKAAEGGADGAAIAEILELADVLVDGPYKEDLRSLELHWCGSSNQRVIDLAKTRARSDGKLVLWKPAWEPPKRPDSW